MKDTIVYYYYADSSCQTIKCDRITAHCIRNQGRLNNHELIPVLHCVQFIIVVYLSVNPEILQTVVIATFESNNG